MLDISEGTRGLTAAPVPALRYSSKSADPYESTGLLMSLIPERSRVLDIGCGTGSISSLIRDSRGATILGIEPNPERAQKAQSEGLQVIQGVYDDSIPKLYGTFDVILFADVLEHLVNPVDILEQVKVALNPTGRVLASIPNVAHWTVRARLLAGSFEYKPTGIMDATHLRWFTRRSVRRLFDAAGYDIETFVGSAGAWLGPYQFTPLRFLSDAARSKVLSKFSTAFPGLFAVQHVVAASPKR